jgi:excisionase family DNA binding protein
MQTLNLDEAALFLKCSDDTVRELAASGEIPAAKVGRAWVFVDVDLVEWLRTQYAHPEDKKCHSTSAAKRGGSISPTTDKELESLLTQPTARKHSRSTTAGKPSYGTHKKAA